MAAEKPNRLDDSGQLAGPDPRAMALSKGLFWPRPIWFLLSSLDLGLVLGAEKESVQNGAILASVDGFLLDGRAGESRPKQNNGLQDGQKGSQPAVAAGRFVPPQPDGRSRRRSHRQLRDFRRTE